MPNCDIRSREYYDEKFWVFRVSGVDALLFRDLDHFTFDTIGSQRVGVPFLIKVYAKDSNGVTITSFNAVCGITTVPDNYFGDTIAHFPPFAKFRAGIWTGTVNLRSDYSGWVRITTSGTYQIKIFGGGKSSLSNTFEVS
jgi:hypothetical protein